jgi:hypothetical protein
VSQGSVITSAPPALTFDPGPARNWQVAVGGPFAGMQLPSFPVIPGATVVVINCAFRNKGITTTNNNKYLCKILIISLFIFQ